MDVIFIMNVVLFMTLLFPFFVRFFIKLFRSIYKFGDVSLVEEDKLLWAFSSSIIIYSIGMYYFKMKMDIPTYIQIMVFYFGTFVNLSIYYIVKYIVELISKLKENKDERF